MLSKLRSFASLVSQVRSDGWENILTGLGTARDKTTYGQFGLLGRIPDNELQNMFNCGWLARKVVSYRAKEVFREGFCVEDGDVEKYIKSAQICTKLQKAMTFSRLYGGGLLIGGLDDGQPQDAPLSYDSLQELRYLTFLDRRYCTVHAYYTDPNSPKYLTPMTYSINPPQGVGGVIVHETRCIRFGGAETDDQTSLQIGGWDYSVLQSTYEVIRAFETAWQSVNVLISDASQSVFKIKGLINALASPGGIDTMNTRMQLIDLSRSVARAIVLDADHNEDFHRDTTSFGGLPELLDRGMMLVAGAADTPVSILFGRSAAGMNATGESDFRIFYDSVKSEQETHITPIVNVLLTWATSAKKGPTNGVPYEGGVKWKSLWQPEASVVATTEKTFADRDVAYINAGVWTPEEVAFARKEGSYTAKVEIDEGMRQVSMVNEKKLQGIE